MIRKWLIKLRIIKKVEVPDSFTIEITTEDFANSQYFDNTNCSLAKALRRRFPDENVYVTTNNARIGNNLYTNIDTLTLRDSFFFDEENLKGVWLEIYQRCGKLNKAALTLVLQKV